MGKIGDISRRLDKRAKDRVNEITGKKEYKFGDLSRWADSAAKERVANYTGKANYEVGKKLQTRVFTSAVLKLT